ncbi:MAG: hypothetical protein IJ047_07585 [Paludibacteraceae bacterium]|nr:hypothetical protein [Paludibacteraceae bacterium]
MKKQWILVVLALLPLSFTAQGQEADAAPAQEKKSGSKVFTGISGGMLLHAGYLFSDDPTKVFSNTGLGSADYVKNLPRAGAAFGLGGMLRIHFINHIHLGGEGHMSTMPLMNTGSNIRTGWGGAFADFYANWGKVRPMIGLSVGGGTMKRLYVPDQKPVENPGSTPQESTTYNSSYVKTPFFYMDPYVGLEISLTNHIALMIRIDYMLPFGRTSSGLTNLGNDVKWSNFMTPSGPRLYVGVMFGQLNR